MSKPEQRNERFLRLADRKRIAQGLAEGMKNKDIAILVGKDTSTIWREVKRGTDPDTGLYCPYLADENAYKHRQSKPRNKVLDIPPLLEYVKDKLAKKWSPEQISANLALDFPDNKTMRASTETIYQAIYLCPKGQLLQETKKALRSGRTRRKPHTDPSQRTERFREPMVMISERPASVEERAIPGHWEGDLITGAANRSAIGTLVERTTRFVILLYLPNRHDALSVQEAIVKKMRTLPKLLRNSLTWDQGSEMALHSKIKTKLDMDVYFCDPHSPWQRGTNENTNGLLRQYFPKGTDLSIYSEDYLDAVAEELNDRPRKTFGWAKPSEKILELLTQAETTRIQ